MSQLEPRGTRLSDQDQLAPPARGATDAHQELESLEQRLLGSSAGAEHVRRVATRSRGLDAHRLLDLALTIALLPLFLVVGLAVAIVVYLDSPGPLFYRAARIGRHGRPFRMWKFRKMVRDAGGPALTSFDDERLTPVGRFLTAARLDELPQVWNVLKGDMRLVGPRPELAEFVSCYPEEYAEILTVTPGLTGPSQVRHVREGRLLAEFGDEWHDRYRESIMPLKIALDLSYVRAHTLRGDLAILARTLLLPFSLGVRASASAVRHAIQVRALAPMAGMVLLVAMYVAQAGPLR